MVSSISSRAISRRKGNITEIFIGLSASHLLPQLSGKIVPTRAQAIAAQPTSNQSIPWSMGLGSNDGFEYGLQRPVNSDTLPENRGKPPLVIFGGGRWKADGMEWGISDDGTKDGKISEVGFSFCSDDPEREIPFADETLLSLLSSLLIISVPSIVPSYPVSQFIRFCSRSRCRMDWNHGLHFDLRSNRGSIAQIFR